MAETSADVRRDIEMTRNRISDTLTELEQKMNVTQIVKDNPWPALALAVGAGVLLSGSGSDMKAAAATVTATKGASSRIGTVLDDLVAQVVNGFHGAIESKVEDLANDVKRAIGAPVGSGSRNYGASVNTGANASASSFNTGVSGDGASAGVPRAD
jgi:Protein of unknown function (DUF3618)